jgi:hypothetical protein
VADTGKTSRVSRTTVGADRSFGGNMPTQSTQLVERRVHEYRSRSTGLEGLNQAIASFFSQAQQGLNSVQQGVFIGEQQRIEQENAAQKRQGAGDALLGKDMDQGQSGDLDYYDAFRSVKAQRDGFSAYQDFNKWYLEDWLPQNPMGDLMGAREEWARTNLMGSDDPDYDGQVLASFFSLSDTLVPKHQEFALKYQINKGIENLGAAIEARVASGTMTPENLASFFEQARVLDPLNEAEARSRVMSALMTSADNHPENMMGIAAMLDAPGTGMNGKSFAQSWPEEYAKFQAGAVEAWNSVNEVADLKTMVDLEDRLRDAKTEDDLINLYVDTIKFRETRGAFRQTATLLDAITKAGEDLDKRMNGIALMDQLQSGDTDGVEPTEAKKAWTPWLEQRFGVSNIMDMDPALAVKAIRGLGGVAPDELSLQLSAAITDTRNPAAQAQAIQIVSGVTGENGRAYAKAYLSGPAAQLYETVAERMQLTNEPIENVLKHVNEARSGIKDWETPWTTLVGEKEEPAALKKVTGEIDNAFRRLIGKEALLPWDNRTPKLPADLMDAALELARVKAIEGAAFGRSWEESVRSAVESVATMAEVLPGENGSLIVAPSSFFSKDGQDGRGMTPYIGDDGKQAFRPRMGYNVLNPTTGRTVNTVEVYQRQLQQMDEKHSWVFRDGSASTVALSQSMDPQVRTAGAFEVLDHGEPIVFAPGEEVVIGPGEGVKVTLPADASSMDFILADIPDGFKFMPTETPYGTAWRLVFRPTFGDEAGKTIDQREASFTPPSGDPSVGIETNRWKLPQFDIGLIKDKDT